MADDEGLVPGGPGRVRRKRGPAGLAKTASPGKRRAANAQEKTALISAQVNGQTTEKTNENQFADGPVLHRAYAWLGLVLRVLFVFGAAFSFQQYLEARDDQRINRAFELVARWHSDGLDDARQRLDDRIVELRNENAGLYAITGDPASVNKLIGKSTYEKIGTERAHILRNDYQRLLFFLNEAAFCVQRNICSADVMNQYFRDYARSFVDYFGPTIERARAERGGTFGEILEQFVQS